MAGGGTKGEEEGREEEGPEEARMEGKAGQ